MRVLLDTQLIVRWFWDERLPSVLPEILGDDNVSAYVSRASQWELAIKIGNGKLRLDLPRLSAQVEADGFQWLDIKQAHLLEVARLPLRVDHKDPFDRLLVAQSLAEPLILLTTDSKLKDYGSTVRVV